MASGWDCPFCNRVATLIEENVATDMMVFDNGNKHGKFVLETQAVICPNPDCREYVLIANLFRGIARIGGVVSKHTHVKSWRLRPDSSAKVFPDYIPAPLLADYTEACLIRDLSPKASATLSRRCLQGMIRDFWKVKKPNLYEEINAIQDKVDPAIWQAIDAVRSIGNIGAHMEKDINLVIDVDPDEAKTLIRLIEVLFEEWYINRQQRAEHLSSIVAIANAKKSQKASSEQKK
jgi:hypothetical protein